MAALDLSRLTEPEMHGEPALRHVSRPLAPVDKVAALPTEVSVKRSDPVYNAHAYLTKVPYSAIVPFVDALTEQGDTVLDLFAGSGMTGVAAAMTGRHAELRDISVLGRHIGTNYVRLVDGPAMQAASESIRGAVEKRLGELYAARCIACNGIGTLSKTVWSFKHECGSCGEPVAYYDAFKASGWRKASMVCPSCSAPFQARGARRIGEVPVLDYVRCGCSDKLLEQRHARPLVPVSLDDIRYPDVEIGADRQMFQVSALRKHGLLSTACFFSDRNLAVLGALHEAISDLKDKVTREKLLFAFTAILTRASKRYQWHPKRPLNAANQNYYIAPVFYEWNVYELFARKVRASIRSDEFVRVEMSKRGVTTTPRVRYQITSADALDLPDRSVDYVFTDPPFGSQIFYSDMNLFQEAWLGCFTDHEREAVVDRAGKGPARRSAERYERLIGDALKECRRVVKDDGWISLVFSSSGDEMWSLIQRAIHDAGLVLEHVALLDKGQRSVKGLTSGFESVVTSDLILTMRKARVDEALSLEDAPSEALGEAIQSALERPGGLTPTRVYLWIVRTYLRREWKIAGVTIAGIRDELLGRGYELDPATGVLVGEAAIAA